MKTKTPVSTKKQTVALKDLKTKKNPKGGEGAPCSLKVGTTIKSTEPRQEFPVGNLTTYHP